jgi:hypothetical protein
MARDRGCPMRKLCSKNKGDSEDHDSSLGILPDQTNEEWINVTQLFPNLSFLPPSLLIMTMLGVLYI